MVVDGEDDGNRLIVDEELLTIKLLQSLWFVAVAKDEEPFEFSRNEKAGNDETNGAKLANDLWLISSDLIKLLMIRL